MITHCPHCDTHFRVTADQLKAAAGKVRCSHCHEIFDALANLKDAPSDPAPSRLDDSQEIIAGIDMEQFGEGELSSDPDPQPEPQPAPEPESQSETPAPQSDAIPPRPPIVPDALADDLAAFERSRRGPLKTLLWGLAILMLTTGLLAQAAYFMNERLVRNPTLQPWIERFCAVAQCEVAIPSDRDAIVVTQRDVRRHPKFKNALLIGLTVENQAPFEQPYPVLRVNFTDVGGNPVARRYFQPSEYLSMELGTDELMPQQTPVLIRLEIADPGTDAISYQFDFF